MTKTVNGYAKINLHLDIGGIRDDGYHDVEIVMQTLTLCDKITVSINGSGSFSCECDIADVPTGEKNIAVRAAMLYAEAAELDFGVHLKIEKNIPMAAGLAGGSTDAAATLVALNGLFDNKLGEDELLSIGSKLGADVPFCIRGGCAYTDGRGDVLHSFPSIPKDLIFVIACGGEGVSTLWAYRLMDETHDNFKNYETRGAEKLRDALLSDNPESFTEYLFNIFEEHVLHQRPIAKEIKSILVALGAKAAMMSGSGPSVFGIFDSEEQAKIAENAIKEKGYFAAVCYPTAL